MSDPKADCIKVFSEEGKFLYNIGSGGFGDGQLNNPVGLVIDKFNNLIVCDTGNRRLQIFGLDGTFVTKIEKPSSEGNSSPWFVAMPNNGKGFATDLFNDCVYVFQ